MTYLFTIANVALLWHALPAGKTATMRQFKRIVDHLLLGIRHVNETAPREQRLWLDLGFLFRGAVMIAARW